MRELIKRELKGFFASLSGYVILTFFLVANGLFLWVIPGEYNIPESGVADLQPFFSLAPVLYLFLVPVLSMRLFAEERRTGTLELLLTRPVSVWRIVWAKYLSGFLLVLFSILPTLVYPVSLWFLAQPAGNIDTGGIIGSYIGLLFLSGIYVAAGVWASSLTDNQIIAFLYALVFSFLLFTGFDFLSEIPFLTGIQHFLLRLGIHFHYEPMSRGVIDIGDVVYFLSLIAFFMVLTVRRFKKAGIGLAWWLLILAGLNVATARLYWRADITDDRRYTLSDNTRYLLQHLDRRLEADIFLAGNLPPEIQKLQYATTRMLEEFRRITGNRLRYTVIDPADIRELEEKKQLVRYLAERGIMPVNLNRTTEDETLSQQIIFPGLVIYDDSTEVSVNLLQNLPGYGSHENIGHSIEALEYELTKAIRLVTRRKKKSIAFLVGQGELPYAHLMDITQTLSYYYRVDFVSTDSLAEDPGRYEALIIAKPTQNFSDRDKYIVDQYVMQGGRVLWCLDEVEVDHEALKERETTYAVYCPLNIEDMLFKYGVRINPDLLLDGNCVLVPVLTGMNGTTPQYSPGPWYYSPLLVPGRKHPVTSGLQPIRVDYANSIDTVGGTEELKKTVLLTSSRYAARVKTPCPVSLTITEEKMTEDKFNRSDVAVAVLVEGRFSSLFRYTGKPATGLDAPFLSESDYNRMIVVADGDILRNEVRGVGENARILPLGYDEYSGRMYGNRDFILNCINLLCDDEGWMSLRGRHLSYYLLNKTELKTDRYFWEFLNLFLPLTLVFAGGLFFYLFRRQKYKSLH